ncbi:hypothetical protein L1080_033510 [Rhodococcus sp. MSC1_016]|jgi:hypothetical protein|uniref:hypothetical protein n=1 Tax=Rhodococcus sp. MSC1_016 TaxID=2909266 RepID=UPI00202FB47D|nr:hypothetical protein [Rhodococcus sp. MSC1_016]
MANIADPAWQRFRDFISGDMRASTPRELAELFNDEQVTAKTIIDWRRGHGRPKLADLPRLSNKWTSSAAHHGDVDELFFARMLGAVPDADEALAHEVWLHRRVFELRSELRDLETSVRNSDTTEATGAIVAATTATQNWAVAVQPAIEGPDGLEFHVADYLDFRRVYANHSDASLKTERAELERELHPVLDRYGAVYAPTAPTQWRSAADSRDERKNDAEPQTHRLRYSVRHTIAERSPDRQWPYKHVPAVAVVSLTDGPWPADVAALIARMLGYGFFTTRKIAQGYRVNDEIPTSDELNDYRSRLHAEHLRKPWPRYVWAHRGTDVAPGRFLPTLPADPAHTTPQSGPLHVVWLREKPKLVNDLVKGRGLNGTQEAAIRHGRIEVEQQVRALSEVSEHVQVHTIDCESVGPGHDDRKGPRWDRSFRLAREAAELILGAGFEDVIEPHISELSTKRHRDPIDACMVEWLGRDTLHRQSNTAS